MTIAKMTSFFAPARAFAHILPACGLLLLLALPVQAQPAPDYAAVDHIEFFVTDLERALAFYTRLFGTDLWKNHQTPRRYLMLGSSYLALEEREGARVDHVCFGIENFDIAGVHAYLDMQSIPWQDYPSGRDLRVDDRDGIRTQLAQYNTWEQLAGATAAPQAYAASGAAIFQPLALDEIFLTVTNLEVDSLFYSRLLNQTGTMQAGSLWFTVGSSRLRLTQAPVGQSPGVNYFSVLVANTDMEAAAEAVFAAGGIIETLLPNGFSFWDPDGQRIVVRTGALY
jgi:catechol 2,3-dioxygenase-like lactoylglutathione lyase family enzyme